MSFSVLVPRDIVKKGKLDNGSWLAGIVTRRRPRQISNTQDDGSQEAGNRKSAKGYGRKQSKEKASSRQGLEMHLCGGQTPADVILLEAWDPAVRMRLEPFSKIGTCFRVTNIEVKEHTDKSFPWTTSRLQFFGHLPASSQFESMEPNPEWLPYHPVTPVASLQHVADGRLVCVAGRVMNDGPSKKNELVAGERVNITSFTIRHENGVIDVTAWRDQADMPMTLTPGQMYYFSAIKKITKRGGDRTNIALRYASITEQTDCPEALHAQLGPKTSTDAEGATAWSRFTQTGAHKVYKKVDAQWFTLSVCDALISGQEKRQLETVVQVPSVLVSLQGDSITYLACPLCFKGVQNGQKTCSCASDETIPRWKAHLRLLDSTGVLIGSCWSVMQSFANFMAESESDDMWKSPACYEGHTERVEQLMTVLNAVPFTLLLSFQSNDYTPGIEAIIQEADPTFTNDLKFIRHPRKNILRCSGDAPCCPPCAMMDTSFDEGAGVAVVPGGSAECFRGLLEIMDKPPTAERESDTSPACRVSRKAACVLRPQGDTTTYTVTLTGPINVATRLLAPRKGEVIHAVLTWRSKTMVTVIAFAPALEARDIDAYKKFFALEVDLHKNTGDTEKITTLPRMLNLTPERRSLEATAAASALATPEPWSKRARAE